MSLGTYGLLDKTAFYRELYIENITNEDYPCSKSIRRTEIKKPR